MLTKLPKFIAAAVVKLRFTTSEFNMFSFGRKWMINSIEIKHKLKPISLFFFWKKEYWRTKNDSTYFCEYTSNVTLLKKLRKM